MKILLISDEESSSLWDHYQPEKLEGYDLIISCGDLKPEYLSFLVTMGKAPLLYVHGNHDVQYDYRRPDGCICIEDRIVNVAGLRILGLGGSGSWASAEAPNTAAVPTSSPSGRCAGESGNCGRSCWSTEAWI